MHFQAERPRGTLPQLLLFEPRKEDATRKVIERFCCRPQTLRNLPPQKSQFSSTRTTTSERMIGLLFAALAVACLAAPAFAETCIASRYGYAGARTSSGERMNPSAMTAAHRSRPFGSHVTVTSHSSGRSVTVEINDRGPFVKGRCIDLSNGAARVLGMDGTAMVSLSPLTETMTSDNEA